MNIKVGDIVVWYESGSSARKQGQVIALSLDGDKASVLYDKDAKVYIVETSRLKKV